MIGSAILFGNASCRDALPVAPPEASDTKPASYPPPNLDKVFAVVFAGPAPPECNARHNTPHDDTVAGEGLTQEEAAAQSAAKKAVATVAKLKVNVDEFLEESNFLQAHNYVYKTWASCDKTLLAKWDMSPGDAPKVPEVVLDTVVAVVTDEDSGAPRAAGPGDATAAGSEEADDVEFEAARQQRYISAFCPEDIPVDAEASTVMEVSALQRQLEELDQAAQRSVAAEVESAIEGGACLVDEAGRQRVLELCQELRQRAQKLSRPEHLQRLQSSFATAVHGSCPTGVSDPTACPEGANKEFSKEGAPIDTSRIPKLQVPRSSKPLSLFDWRIWTQARPTLWCFGDAANLYPDRQAPLLTDEWIRSLLCREEMEYSVDGDEELYKVRDAGVGWEINRFAADWITLHLFVTVNYFWERHSSAFAFLQQGGMKFAAHVRALTPEMLANASRLENSGGGIRGICGAADVPQTVKQALNAMQMAFADVLGTDGHRTLCRHEGNAYMTLVGPPLIFSTPNVADTKQKLLMVVQGQEVRLDDDEIGQDTLPKYRHMMQRLARDPHGQTVVFELMMRLFFLHVLGIRPGCLKNRRRAAMSERE